MQLLYALAKLRTPFLDTISPPQLVSAPSTVSKNGVRSLASA